MLVVLCKGLLLKQLKSRLSFDITANGLHDLKGVSDLPHVCIHTLRTVESINRVNIAPHGQLMIVFLASMLYVMQSTSQQSDFVRVKR